MGSSVTLNGQDNIYIEKNAGNIYINKATYISPEDAFKKGSYELEMYTPSISPRINRPEVDKIITWIAQETDDQKPERVALLYGKAGIGKSIVMHDILDKLSHNDNYHVLGIKADQIEFADTEDLRKKIHLLSPLEDVIKSLAGKSERVVLLIDQIDALSLSLSSNRTPLRSLMKLIFELRNTRKVRIVVSCRPYDLEYDPMLEQLNTPFKWELKNLDSKDVLKVLKEHKINFELTDRNITFLTNPLHLHLFLKTFERQQNQNMSTNITEEDLYNQLWELYICDVQSSCTNKTRIIAFLDSLIKRMYNKQQLSLHLRLYETDFSDEIKYLQHNEIITLVNERIQFFHQTLFDYVYARRFVENERDLVKELKLQHQGLFVRASIKSILNFLRSTDTNEYRRCIKSILFDKNENGEYSCRYHIRAMILTTLGYYEEPIKEELELVKLKLFNQPDYLNTFIDSIQSISWFKPVIDFITSQSLWETLTKETKEELILRCRRLIEQDTEYILDFALKILHKEDPTDKISVSNIFYSSRLPLKSEKLKEVYDLLYPLSCEHACNNILSILSDNNPNFVSDRLIDKICKNLVKTSPSYLDKVSVSYEEFNILERLENNSPEVAIKTYITLIHRISNTDSLLPEGFQIKFTREFSFFKRERNSKDPHNFVNTIINKVLDQLESDIVSHNTNHENLLRSLAYSDLDSTVYIALYCYSQKPEAYTDEIFKIMTNRKIFTEAPCWIEFIAVDLLKVTYPYYNRQQRDSIIGLLMSLKDPELDRDIDKSRVKEGVNCTIPISWTGHRLGVLLNVLPEEDLKSHYNTAYQKLQQAKRKFTNEQLKNSEPYRVSTSIGWPCLEKEKIEKMSDKAWINSMRKYNTNSHSIDNKPSLMGQCQQLKEIVKQEPNKRKQLLEQAIDDKDIPLSYPLYGMRGLLEIGDYTSAEDIFKRIIQHFDKDINQPIRECSLLDILFAIDDFFNEKILRKSVFEFICRAAMEAEETKDDYNETDIYNRGINQPRGNAGYKLIQSSKYDIYKHCIFSTLEKISHNSSIYTRAAILLNFAVLNRLDRDKSLDLFLSFMHDCNPKLMSLPVHNYNPLVYYVNFAFDKLLPFFEEALTIPECHKEQVCILWIAWCNTNKQDAEHLLKRFCEASESSRVSLVQFIDRQEKFDTKTFEFLSWLTQDSFCSEELSKQFDILFCDLALKDMLLGLRLAETIIYSKLADYRIRFLYNFLASTALSEPIRTLKILEASLNKRIPDDFTSWNTITDILIQAYNGINSFNDEDNNALLEHTMDLLDSIMQRPETKHLMTDFINKLDYE